MRGALLGKGNAAEVYAFGPHVLKLYRAGVGPADPALEIAAMASAAEQGLPVPQVFGLSRHEGRWGIEMSRAEGRPLGEIAAADPGLIGAALERMVRLQVAVHASQGTRLPPLKARLAERIGRAPGLPEARRQALLDRLAALPDGTALCHGDFHPLNLIGQVDGAVTIIDWADARSGPTAADVARSFVILMGASEAVAEDYLAAYAAASGVEAAAVRRWIPIVAAARLCEGIEQQEAMLRRLTDQSLH